MPWIRNRKSGFNIVSSGDVTRSSPVLYSEYCIQDGNLVARFSLLPVEEWTLALCKALLGWFWRALQRMLSFVANIPRAVLGTRVIPDACRILARMGKFDLNTDFFFADFKSIWIQKYYAFFIPFKRCPRQRRGHKIKSFCYHFFNCRVMKSY